LTGESPAPIPFIVNTRARLAAGWRQAASTLGSFGVDVAPHLIDDPREFAPAVARAVYSGAPSVLLGGGDGSVSGAIRYLLRSDVVLGIIPLGTGNGIARSLGMGSIGQACRAVAAGRSRRAAAGRANRSYFLNMASMGLSVDVARGLSGRLKRWTGYGAYPLSIVRALTRARSFDVTAALPGGPIRLRAVQLFAFNGTYAAHWPHIGLIRQTGQLTLCVVEPGQLAQLGFAALRL
jgi:diacylglycerol kinase family enzyme